ncbi:MAG: Asp-tRNA(Asn)/Glu-tRNA(Gln) amidotransferase subunit GatA [Deltaproteobacteria bacterium]|nr:Asp-tRNA(Asn)/Glu-tRNA(Gln) amidotransferase subunit GatA [Deltaproteobacteria bacterium]
MTKLYELTAHELAQKLAQNEISSIEATQACLERIEATNNLGAYLHVDSVGALALAKASDERRRANNTNGPLDGVPMALKDIFLTEGMPTTCGSKILAGFKPPYNGTVVQKLKDAGVVLLGKLNMDEFAMGSSNEYSGFTPARNPWDPERVPGGSSGGCAIAVAAGLAFATLGTDTGGSIRQPAALCGVVGLKPTYSRVSRFGVIAYASSLDQVGPLTKDVTDCAQVLQVIAGHDPHDSTSADVAVPDYTKDIEQGVSGLRLGIPKEYFAPGIDAQVRAAVEAAIKTYEQLGAKISEISLPHTDYAIAAYYLVATAEASSNLARYDGVRYGPRRDPGLGLNEMYDDTRSQFGSEVKRRIMLGTYALSAGYYDAYYGKAQKVRTLVQRDFANAFAQCDALITPTSPSPAFKLGENVSDPIKMYLADVFTVSVNMAGLPGISLPCGFTKDGLPIGIQLIAAPMAEALLLRTARAYEREHKWHLQRPAL